MLHGFSTLLLFVLCERVELPLRDPSKCIFLDVCSGLGLETVISIVRISVTTLLKPCHFGKLMSSKGSYDFGFTSEGF